MRGVKKNLLLMAFVIIPLVFSAWAIQKNIANNTRAEIGRSLATVRDTTHHAVKTWFKDQKAAAVVWANAPQIRASAVQLLALPPHKSTLLDSPAQQALREWFQQLQNATHYQGYFVVGPNNINLASSRDQNVGEQTLLVGQHDFMQNIFAGKPAVSLPVRSKVPLTDDQGRLVNGLPSIFVAAPIRSGTGKVIAIFMFRLDPEEGFTNILKQGRIGNTGETYAFDGKGRLISQSRYDDELRQVGLIPAGERAILNIQLRDPGLNLLEEHKTDVARNQQPLTHTVKLAIQGEPGIDLSGYRDYRGVPVVSAWVWDTELGLGITTELDVQEAYQTLRATQLTIAMFTLFTFFLLIGLSVSYTLFRQRKMAENLVRIEKDKAQLYLDTIETIIVALDTQGNISRVNRKGCDLLDYKEEELIGRNWFTTCLPEAQQDKVRNVFNTIMRGANVGLDYYESSVITRFGENRLIAWHNTSLMSKDGIITGTLSAGEDITQRKQTEDALRESEIRFRLLVEGIGKDYLIYRQSFDGTFQYVSPAIEHFTGIPSEEAVGCKVEELFNITTDSKKRIDEYLQKLEKGEFVEAYEESYVHPDNTIRIVEVIERPQFDESGKPVAVLGIVKDITEHKKVEEELQRAATVFDNTDEGIIVTNAEGKIILVNNAFTDITGYKSEEVLGKNPRSQQSGRHEAAFYRTMWKKLKLDGQWRGEIWNQRKNGDDYPAWENINVVRDERGRISNYVAIFSDISILKESEERMAHLAHHDILTNLPNRLRFIANLEQAIEGAKRRKHKVALMFLDLDRFKYINDTLGHNVGDELLKTIAVRLKDCVRAEDTVARLGGDEFTVVMTEVLHAEDAGLIADKVVKTIGKPVTVDGETITTSVSVGISIFPDDAADSVELLKAADTAMYHAKTRGKNNFQFFTAELASLTLEHTLIEKGLRCALESKEFELYYQPQVSMTNGKIVGVEALIRWNHPEHGQLLPDAFIHIADDSTLIDEISEWVLRTALSDYEFWLNNGSMGPRIAVNITGRQITRKRSIKRILNILEELAPEPNTLQLDLEITETALDDTDRTIDIINTLRRRGVMFAIDDFGTGHSSLSRLKQLPVDTLKIDRSFINDIADEGDDKAIAAAIIAMAHSLGLRVIGEGVENKLQLDVLRTLDCDEIQGFYFSKPVPANEIVRLLDDSFQ